MDGGNNQSMLVLTVENGELDQPLEQLDYFFDKVKKGRRSDGTRVLNLYKRLRDAAPSREVIDQARAVLRQKSRDELMAELQNHRDNLEHTVQERTTQLKQAIQAADTASGEHESRDSHADECGYRDGASGAENRVDTQTAGLFKQNSNFRQFSSGDHQRHSGFLQNRGRQAGYGIR